MREKNTFFPSLSSLQVSFTVVLGVSRMCKGLTRLLPEGWSMPRKKFWQPTFWWCVLPHQQASLACASTPWLVAEHVEDPS